MRKQRKDDEGWRKQFGWLLTRAFELYKLDYRHFCTQYQICSSTVRYWREGSKLPGKYSLEQLIEYLRKNLHGEPFYDEKLYREVCAHFKAQGAGSTYSLLRRQSSAVNTFVVEALVACRSFAKHDFTFLQLVDNEVPPSGGTQAVVFDFDGTLTYGDTKRTTWESIWESLGYGVVQCRNLYQRFERNEIDHSQWCKLTEERFRARDLRRKHVAAIARGIRLIDGVEETFQALQERGIRIYILSGSIKMVIHTVLGGLCEYVDEVRANKFQFDREGRLKEIIGTKYDFAGKATFINELAVELNISPQDILFVGDSANDRYVYQSGARTLCINPKLTDATNPTVWNSWIEDCTDLRDILEFV